MIPKSVTHKELMAAVQPLCDLLGTDPRNYFADPGITISSNGVTFVVPVRHDEDPGGRATSTKERSANHSNIPPHPQGIDATPIIVGECDAAELAYNVTVEVTFDA